MAVGISLQYAGSVFDGRAEHEIEEAAREWTRNLAIVGASMVRSNLNRVLRRQTPYYRLQVQPVARPPDWVIWDRNIIYGPWLEGTGSRNRTTRFKGYATFRRTTQQIDRRATALGEPIVARFVARMN